MANVAKYTLVSEIREGVLEVVLLHEVGSEKILKVLVDIVAKHSGYQRRFPLPSSRGLIRGRGHGGDDQDAQGQVRKHDAGRRHRTF